MSIVVIAVEAVIFCILFTIMIFKTVGEDYNMQVHNYPPEIQEEYFKTHERIPTEPLSAAVIAKRAAGILVFTVILTVFAKIANAESFLQGFLFAFGMMVIIGCYDTFFIDWVLFANLKRFRLPGTEHMDKEYHQKWFHVKGMLFPGIIFALIPACIVGWLVTLF